MKLRILVVVFLSLFVITAIKSYASASSDAEEERVEKKVIVIQDDDDNDIWLGVQIKELTKTLRGKLDVESRRGVVVDDVVEDSPAARAGIKKGDVIVKFNGRKIRKTGDLTHAISKHEAGDIVKVEIERGKENLEMQVELSERPHDWHSKVEIPSLEKLKNIEIRAFLDVGLGVKLQKLNKDLAEYFGTEPDQGVLITEVEEDSPAEDASLKAGDIILSIDGESVQEPDDVWDILGEYDEGDSVKLEILRKRKTQTVTVKLKEGYGAAELGMKVAPHLPNVYFKRYERDMDHYHDSLKRYKDEMKGWKEEYNRELKERLKDEIEKNMEKQELQIEKLQEELKQLRKDVLELQEKVL